ncbi:MAG TPA: hypothetical protein VN256_27210 [Pyrinomonadaceae bacterium]|nr:hypothetical protein [Pyrinomonadaceae bacterium]
MTEFFCNLTDAATPLPHFWEHTVGSDHAPVALRADWQSQLRRCRDELGFRYVRFHGLLSDDLGTLICHREKFLYSFFNADQIFDFLLSIGMKPFVELSFMPKALASWNTSSNPRDPLHDEPYAAAFVTKTVMEANGLVEGYSFWTFSDIFEENYFPSVPFHGGFGLMNLHGIPKPAYRAFELLHQLGTEALPVDGSHETVDAWVARKGQTLTVLVTNHAGPRHPVKTEQVQVVLRNAPGKCYAYVERIDEIHANPKRIWREMGEPEYLSAGEVERLQDSSRMWKEPQSCERVKDDLHLDLILPPHAVAAITVEFPSENGFGGART